MGFLLALPIPFTNFPLGFSLCVLAVGMIAQDGLVIISGLILSAASTIGFALLLDGGFTAAFS